MQLSSLISRIQAVYVPGALAFYSKMDPDPCQQAADKFESVLATNDPELIELAGERYYNTTVKLMQEFRKQQCAPGELSPGDGFMMGDPARVDRHYSLKDRTCLDCEGQQALQNFMFKGDPNDSFFLCRDCRLERSRQKNVNP